MKKFIVTYHVPAAVQKQLDKQMAKATPEQAAEGMKGWMTWAKKCGKHLVDMGSPLANGKRIKAKGKAVKSDKEVAGYSILEAKDMDHAMKLLEGHPHISWNKACTIELHETMAIPGM